MNRLYVICIVSFICNAFLFSQPSSNDVDPSLDILPPSPSAQGLAKYVEFPINYHTGTASIDLPIYNLTGKELSVPISVSYHSGGVKVDEVSSKVGLGWSLNAGGVISRTVMGIADEKPDGFIDRGSQVPYPFDLVSNFDDMKKFASGEWDGKPDIFNFNFGAYSGKFVIDSANVVRVIPHQDLDISYNICNSGCSFPYSGAITSITITTPDGMVYTFGTIGAIEYSETRSYNPNGGGNADCNVKTYETPSMTAWYLKDIYNPKTDDHIIFNYQTTTMVYDMAYTETYVYPMSRMQYNECPNSTSDNLCVTEKTDHAVVLSSIQSNNGSVHFVTGGRSDVSGVAIKEIQIKGKAGALLKKYNLQQTFITSSGNTPSTNPQTKVRMYLDAVQEYSASNQFVNEYAFSYHNRNLLPPRLSFNQDHWGYYNGASNSQLTPRPNELLSTLNEIQLHFPSFSPADRETNANFSDYGMLDQVTYPTGGFASFEFGSNQVGVCDSITEIQHTNDGQFLEYHSSHGPEVKTKDITIDFDQTININYNIVMIGFRCNGAYAKLIDLSTSQVIFEEGGCGQFFNPVTLSGTTSMWLGEGNYRIEVGVFTGPDPFFPPPYNSVPESAHMSIDYAKEVTTFIDNKDFGGIRVEKITYDDGDTDNSNNIVKAIDYNYDANSSGCEKSSAEYLGGFLNYQVTYVSTVSTSIPCSYELCHYYRMTSSSLSTLTNAAGNIVGYREVKELQGPTGESGKRVMKYEVIEDGQSELGPNWFGVFTASPTIDRSFLSGKLIEEQVFDNSGDLLSEKFFDYKLNETINQNKVKGIYAQRLFELPCPQNSYTICDNDTSDEFFLYNCEGPLGCTCFSTCADTFFLPCYNRSPGDTILNANALIEYTIEFYDVISQWVYLEETTERQYTPGTGNYVETITTFNYDKPLGRHTNVTSTVVINSDGKETRTEQKYAPELLAINPGNAVFQDMIDRNILGIPLETLQKVDNIISGGSKIDFSFYDASGIPTSSNSGNPPMPHQFHRYEVTWDASGTKVDNGWNLQATIGEYSLDGFPEKITVDGWSPEYYTWSDGLVSQKSFLNYTWSYGYHSNSRLVTSTTDIDGQVTNYTYDESMRLETVSARNGNVLTTYTYHYNNGGTGHNWVETKTDFSPTSGSGLTEQTSRQYLDGLGRPIQTVQVKHSPDQKDIVTQVVYDAFGRTTREYVPYESAYNDGRYVTVPPSVPYTETEYEDSPLGRVISSTPPSWHATTSAYSVNGNGEVVNPLTSTAFPAQSLSKVVVTDPNGNKSISFTDKLGRQVLSRKTDANGNNVNDTYYDYDDKNRLRTVVPPGATASNADLLFKYVYDGLDNMISKKIPSQEEIVMLYNTRNQLTYSLDGNMANQSKWMMTKYDTYGRVSETGFYQGNPASGDAINSFTERLTKTNYGSSGIAEGKVTYTESKVLGTSNTFIKTWLNYDSYGRMNYSRGNNHQYPNYTYAEYNTTTFDFADNVTYNYRRHHANTSSGFTYIQDYFTFDHSGRQLDYKHRLNFGTQYLVSRNEYNHRDFLTRKLLHETSSSNFLQNIDYYYNDQGWLTQINDFCEPEPELPGGPGGGDPFGGGMAAMGIGLEFNSGAIHEQAASINYRISLDAEIVDEEGKKENRTFSRTVETLGITTGELDTRYLTETDGAPLKFDARIQLDFVDTRIDASQYSEFLLMLEQQVLEKLEMEGGIEGQFGLMMANEVQSVVEEALPIGSGPIALPLGGGGGSGNQEDDLFAMKIYYDTPNTTLDASAQYNGNISHLGWQVACNDEQWYGFTYDHLDRITKAKYAETSFTSGNYINFNHYNLYNLSYDPRGNITTLRRRGLMSGTSTYGLMDLLVYTYANSGASNQLDRIQEWTGSFATKGFKTIASGGIGDYTYDDNGNLISDEHKGITNIDYNHLNLPERIDFANGDWIEWTYDANGTKLKKTTSASNTKDYAGNIEYDNSTIEAIYHSEGRCTPDGSSWQYEYALRDHLGNTRVTFADLDGSNDVDETEILQQNHYYPFGMNQEGSWSPTAANKYQYNGKELNEDFGLDWNDYGARFYDAAMARWLTVDPLADKYYDWSPYNYVLNNPMKLIDPDGREPGDPEDIKKAATNAVKYVKKNYGESSAQCNRGVCHAFKELADSDELNGMRANEIINHIENSPDFEEVKLSEVQELANEGEIIIGGRAVEGGSGHVVLAVPGEEVSSSGWGTNGKGKKAPVVMDTGYNMRSEKQGASYSWGKKKRSSVKWYKYNKEDNKSYSGGTLPTIEVKKVQLLGKLPKSPIPRVGAGRP